MEDDPSDSKKNIYLEVINEENIEGQVLKNRFMVSNPLDQGSFGMIYDCIDLNKPSCINVVKVSDNYQMLGREIEALKDIKAKDKTGEYDYPYDYTPSVVSKGMFILEKPSQAHMENRDKAFMSYYVMTKYGRNLENIFAEHNYKFSSKTIYQLGIKLLDVIEKIHDAGYTYNDLKLDNILVGD